jgi:leader peptidase (prepilin peptidase)/N-methyltransferase
VQAAAIVIVVLFGLAVGSFLCVIIDRLPVKLDEPNAVGDLYDTRPWNEVLGGTSRCSTCGEGVRPRDNIPVLGWLLLRGRCRECGAHIPAFHPIVELLVPALAVVVYWRLEGTWLLLPALWLVVMGVAIGTIDTRTMIVPTRLVWPAFFGAVATSVVAALAEGEPRWLVSAVIGVLVVAGPLFLLWYVLPTHLGFGDVRLATFLGFTVGFAAAAATGDPRLTLPMMLGLIMMTLAAVIGIVVGLVMRAGFGQPFPFGPALIAAAIFCVAWAEPIMRPYLT